ncbi:hypothetical protein [Arhodomonas sp. AD133]|uniref:hypothetical protein n=1 Tax=Arhodomonas sp. AD133 TaxID=3415009 RepID=UPI003EBCCDB7
MPTWNIKKAQAEKLRAEAALMNDRAERLENAAAAEAANPYLGDDYTREGCTASIDVTRAGYVLSVFDPMGLCIERYAAVGTPAAIGQMLREWCAGRPPTLPRTRG